MQDELLALAELAGSIQPLGPFQYLAQRRCVGGIPGKAVGGELLAFQCRIVDAPAADTIAKLGARFLDEGLGGAQCLAGKGKKVLGVDHGDLDHHRDTGRHRDSE